MKSRLNAHAGTAWANRETKPADDDYERQASFAGTHFVFECGDMKILRNGGTQITIIVPYESSAAALRLRDAYGVLLEADVTPVTRVAP